MQVFALFSLVAVIFEIYGSVTAHLGLPNLNVLHIYTVIEYSFLAYFLSIIVEKKRVKDIILISIPIYVVMALFYSIFVTQFKDFNGAGRVAECILLSGFALYWFYSLLESDEHTSLKRYPEFWLNSGITLYFMGNVFMFMLYSLMNTDFIEYWTVVHSLLNIMANLLYFIGFICNPRPRK